jgi:hypothetical protein
MRRLYRQDSGELNDFWLLYHAKTFIGTIYIILTTKPFKSSKISSS